MNLYTKSIAPKQLLRAKPQYPIQHIFRYHSGVNTLHSNTTALATSSHHAFTTVNSRIHTRQTHHKTPTTTLQAQKRKHSPFQTLLTRSMSTTKRLKLPNMRPTKPATQSPSTPLIIRFYDPTTRAKDSHGRTQSQILAWPNNELEACHNYIQILFPLPEGSPFNFAAPVIDREVMLAFRARGELRSGLKRSFERMLGFYGFMLEGGGEETEIEVEKPDQDRTNDEPETTVPDKETTPYSIVRAPHWPRASRNWARRVDHNHLRITRILRCLRVLGLEEECVAFFAALQDVYDDPGIQISERSMMYWGRAVMRPLFVAPDDEEIAWLRVWEEGEGGKLGEEGEKRKRGGEGEGDE
ncbi:hypothetical protein P153DRAFT_352101 [Dothidotthia symphoricarpi CBS 119687]|uniref:Opioid growth factor receptor (OGFr) conserved domain-containing protein n=1 Tax=Dothidotthia symphoricarpi CBS 119687 TaxID=1392245 RepID=A0A6A5ZYQ6_9PLEO|nr:uncharacterized protein P153DRAFT_352101 [Dothidotthia symphoricarpi CBS 119687]KAF2123451.1 hypothetical protein P153DRAFT_352101 [Dothidotthia symphoricarpi CBS 119687]